MAEATRQRRTPVDTTRVLAGRVHAHAGDVARIVRHLVDNAARHAVEAVAIAVATDGRNVVVIVDDDGAGVPDDRPRPADGGSKLCHTPSVR